MAIHIGRVKPIRRHSKISTCYEIGQQADHHQLERLLIEASVTSSLLCPINGYQHTFRCSVRSMVSPISLPFDINTPSVALSDRRISTPSLGLPVNVNDYKTSTCHELGPQADYHY